MRIEKTIPKGWTAFVQDSICLGYSEFINGGKAVTSLTLVTKPTEAELKAELTKLKITLTK